MDKLLVLVIGSAFTILAPWHLLRLRRLAQDHNADLTVLTFICVFVVSCVLGSPLLILLIYPALHAVLLFPPKQSRLYQTVSG